MAQGTYKFEIPLGSTHKVTCKVNGYLGSGAFGQVAKVRTRNGTEFAMKMIECEGRNALKSAASEMSALLETSHENIVQLFSVGVFFNWKDVPVLHLLMEFCEGGTLNRRLEEEESTNVPQNLLQNLRWMRQMSHAVKYLHKKRIAHRDLKPENILLTADLDAKIADLGLAGEFIPMSYFVEVYSTVYMKEEVGTPFWMAPEVFEKRGTEKSDVFSLGIIFHSIQERQFYKSLKGSKPQKIFCLYIEKVNSKNRLKKKGLGDQMLKHGEEVLKKVTFNRNGPDNDISKLIMKTLTYDFHKRPTARDVFVELKEITKKFQKKQNLEMDVDEELGGIEDDPTTEAFVNDEEDATTEATSIDDNIVSLGLRYTWQSQEFENPEEMP